MNYIMIGYPKCSTCIKAKKYLEAHKIPFEYRHIVEENPTKEELSKWIKMSGFDIKKFFNTSGNGYKELNLKDKLQNMSEDEKISLLASNGMLVKRPLLIQGNTIIVGFKESEYPTTKN